MSTEAYAQTEQLPSPRLVAAARVLLGISQAELADAASIARTTVARYEAGRGGLQADTLSKILAALNARGVRFQKPDKEVSMGVALLRPENSV